MPVCPSIESLEQHAGGTRNPEVEKHLAQCQTCTLIEHVIIRNNEFALGLDELKENPLEHIPAAETFLRGLGRIEITGYGVAEEIHVGGQATVYRGVQLSTRRTVAIKMLHRGAFATSRQRRRFEQEIDLVSSLDHSGIVTLLDRGVTQDGRPYLIAEYIDGVGLDKHFGFADGRRMSHPRCAHWLTVMAKTCQAVEYAHSQGVIHRDLKPGNILIDRHQRPHLLDFGMAKVVWPHRAVNSPAVSLAEEFLGTIAYAAPEQLMSSVRPIDQRTDVYALGVILYEGLTGQRPYQLNCSLREAVTRVLERSPTKPSQINPSVSRELDAIVCKALAKDPYRRYQSVRALRSDIEAYLQGRPVAAKSDSVLYYLRKRIGRHRKAVFAWAAIVLLAATLGVSLPLLLSRASHAEQNVFLNEHLFRQYLTEMKTDGGNFAFTLNENSSIAKTSDESQLAIGNRDGEIKIYSGENRQLRRTVFAHDETISALAFSPTAPILAAGTASGTVSLWNTDTWRKVTTLAVLESFVSSIGFHASSQLIAMTSYNGEVIVQDISTGVELFSDTLDRSLYTASFATDGDYLVLTDARRYQSWVNLDTGTIRPAPPTSIQPSHTRGKRTQMAQMDAVIADTSDSE